MAEAHTLYVYAANAAAGGSVITLGLLHALRQRGRRVGFLNPVRVRGEYRDAALMRAACDLEATPEQMSPLTLVEARDMMARGRERAMLNRISSAYDQLRGTGDLIVLQGINYERSVGVLDMDINAAVAARLDASVVLVAGASLEGRSLPANEIVASVRAAWSSLQARGCDPIGVIVNRVVGDSFDAARDEYVAALRHEGLTVLGVLPELDYLGMPRLTEVVQSLGAEVLSGSEFLGNIVVKTLVAAMEPRNFLRWLTSDGTLIVVPGDRDDVVTTVALTQRSATHRRISGLVLTGGLQPVAAILELVTDRAHAEFPILSAEADTYQAVDAIRSMKVRIAPHDDDKIHAATPAFARYVDVERFCGTLRFAEPHSARGGSFLENIVRRAKQHNRVIVFPEGQEPRTVRAVARLARDGVVRPVLLGGADAIAAAARDASVSLDGVQTIDPAASAQRERYADVFYEIRRHKRGGMTRETALQWVDKSPIHYGTVMVQCGEADGMVAGAVHSTGDTIRPALQVIGVRPDVGVASSVFFMVFKDRVLVYGDCAIVPSPNAQELASIAIAAARTARTFGVDPRVALLSYSTGGSGSGNDVDKVSEATQIVREREPLLAVDGPMQYDAAIDPQVGRSKQPDSPVAGRATVFVFPDLDAGNIAYKAVQRMSGALAVGPIMQGMNRPVNDLSRGCSVDDIYYVAAITALQASRPAGNTDDAASSERRDHADQAVALTT